MPYVFKGKKAATRDKVRGGYYTPRPLSDFLCSWSIRTAGESILEPSCGDGGFIEAVLARVNALEQGRKSSIVGIEIDPGEHTKAVARFSKLKSPHYNLEIVQADFFQQYPSLLQKKFNVVLGNPPFIRFQHFEEQSQKTAFKHLESAGYHPTKLANCWAAFVQLGMELLHEGGRLAMVLPAELLQVNYAEELRKKLAKCFQHIVLVTFRKLVFADIQQEVVLLLAEGKTSETVNACDIHTIEFDDESQLTPNFLADAIAHSETKHTHANVKWTALFLSDKDFETIRAAKAVSTLKTLGDFVSVDVGIVTGRNDFFCVSKSVAKKFSLKKFVIPIVGKTAALRNITFTKKDYANYTNTNGAFLLNLKGVPERKFNEGLREYIALGEKAEIQKGFKCGSREPWYAVPSVSVPDGFLFRQIHKYPLLVANAAKAASTDTIHRITKRGEFPMKDLCASFVNSLTFCLSEIGGRSYGGGVLELEPTEAEHLRVPYSADVKIDAAFVSKCIASDKIERALDYVDNLLLAGVHGFTQKEIAAFRRAWKQLRDRRINRK